MQQLKILNFQVNLPHAGGNVKIEKAKLLEIFNKYPRNKTKTMATKKAAAKAVFQGVCTKQYILQHCGLGGESKSTPGCDSKYIDACKCKYDIFYLRGLQKIKNIFLTLFFSVC